MSMSKLFQRCEGVKNVLERRQRSDDDDDDDEERQMLVAYDITSIATFDSGNACGYLFLSPPRYIASTSTSTELLLIFPSPPAVHCCCRSDKLP